MSYTPRKQKSLDPDSPDQMDAFNDEYSNACRMLGIPRDQMLVTFEQAGEYLDRSVETLRRYAAANPPTLDAVRVMKPGTLKATLFLTLDSVVEYKMLTRRFSYKPVHQEA